MKILLLGSSGLLGKELNEILKKKFEVTNNGIKKRKVNLTLKNNLKKILLNKKYDLIINAIASTNIDFCENNKKASNEINVNIIKNIFFLKNKFKLKFKFIQFSTDQVYNLKKNMFGKENFNNNPLNEYTKQKILAEKICIKNSCLIFRINFFLNKKGSIFHWVIQKARSRKKFILFKDVYFSPLRIKTICKIIFHIIKYKKTSYKGIYNLGSKTSMSKSKFAINIIKKLNIYNSKHILDESKKYFTTKRPKNMSMNVNKFEKKFQIPLPILKKEIIDEIKENT